MQHLVEECRAAVIAGVKVSVASQVQQQVYQVLGSLGGDLQLETEHIAEWGLFCIDIAQMQDADSGWL